MPPATDRLLAEHPFGEGDPLVRRAAREAADTDRGEDEVGAAQRLVEVGGGAHGGRVGDAGGLFRQYAGDGPQPVRVGVVQRDLGDPAFGVVAEQRSVHQGHSKSATAENRQPHAPIVGQPGPRPDLRPAEAA